MFIINEEIEDICFDSPEHLQGWKAFPFSELTSANLSINHLEHIMNSISIHRLFWDVAVIS